jgi:uroporphyrin-III C-methyltransferase
MTMNKGKVILVGAGPGDPELLTLKAVKALQQAEVVLVDDLVDRRILQYASRARIVDVGKRGGCKSTPQKFINRMMIALAEYGHTIVRLKGGDPFLFGRGGEEMLALQKADVPVEIVPGITSGCAVPASLGIPITHRDMTRGVSFVTGHTQQGETVNWRALAESRTTLVIYMGLGTLPDIVQELLHAGMPADMPAAAIHRGTQPEQQQVIATLDSLADEVKLAGLQSPTLIVIGKVVDLASVADMPIPMLDQAAA